MLMLVVNSIEYGSVVNEYIKCTSDTSVIFSNPTEVDIVMFTGGEDVHPKLYNGKDCGLSYHNFIRDSIELEIAQQCVKYGIKMTGICRGFQFINVFAGGKMYQHIETHPYIHTAFFNTINKQLKVNSTHHQLVDLPDGSIPIIWAEPKLVRKAYDFNGNVSVPRLEIEGAIFPNINAFGVQFHPEIMHSTEPAVIEYKRIFKKFLDLSIDEFSSLFNNKRAYHKSG